VPSLLNAPLSTVLSRNEINKYMIAELTLHAFALKFPALPQKDCTALKADIELNGQLHPIVINEKNEILDGRHRYEIVRELGLEPRVVQLSELLGGKQVNEIDFIFSANFHRRHLTDDQRVAIFAEFLPQLRKEAQENLKSTLIMGRLKGGVYQKRRPDDVPLKQGGVRIKLAHLANVGAGKAQRTIAIADRDPELLGQVSRGEKKLETAYHELVHGQPAPGTTEPPRPTKPVEVQMLEYKIDKWLGRFLARFDRSQCAQVLRVICAIASARLEKFSSGSSL
jgi:hypothetical protein